MEKAAQKWGAPHDIVLGELCNKIVLLSYGQDCIQIIAALSEISNLPEEFSVETLEENFRFDTKL